ncbi:Transcriptional repressor TUP1 [Pichia kudriavzevii]|uniref:diphosphomevalonate decarboxylase n=2 Tax=Pichia kudriavzevii TaxID=4909 RepID=A0A1V2LVN1_PICKU|nr:Transcriptional repressor TUP1 [Pichia kudriavzevii]
MESFTVIHPREYLDGNSKYYYIHERFACDVCDEVSRWLLERKRGEQAKQGGSRGDKRVRVDPRRFSGLRAVSIWHELLNGLTQKDYKNIHRVAYSLTIGRVTRDFCRGGLKWDRVEWIIKNKSLVAPMRGMPKMLVYSVLENVRAVLRIMFEDQWDVTDRMAILKSHSGRHALNELLLELGMSIDDFSGENGRMLLANGGLQDKRETSTQKHAMPSRQHLDELLEAVKAEFDNLTRETSRYKDDHHEYELKLNQQHQELTNISNTVYELEQAHRSMKDAYEREIMKLKQDLGAASNTNTNTNAGVTLPPIPGTAGSSTNSNPNNIPQISSIHGTAPPIPSSVTATATAAGTPKTEQTHLSAAEKSASPKKSPTGSTASTADNSKSQALVKRAQHNKPIPAFLKDFDAYSSLPYKQQHNDYYLVYNPNIPKKVDISLVHSFDHTSVVCCVSFSKDGKFLATGCNKLTQVFSVETGDLVARLNDESSVSPTGGYDTDTGDLYIRSVCFSPDGKFLATGAEDKIIRIWDLATRTIVKYLKGHEQDIYSLDFFPDGKRLVSGSGDRTVRIWDVYNGQCSLTLSIEDGVTTVAVSPDGSLIAAGSLDRTVRVWDANKGYLVERLDSSNEFGNGHMDSVYSVTFTNNGKEIASGSLDRTIKLWSLKDLDKQPSSVSKSNCEVTYVGHKDFVLSVCCTPDDQFILSGSKDRGVIMWDKESGEPYIMLQGHRNSVISVSVSPVVGSNGGYFATEMIYHATATGPVNIATLKYWGKRDKDLNLPTNNSISVTLDQADLRTLTTASCSSDFKNDQLWINNVTYSLDTPRSKQVLADLRSLRKELEANDDALPKIAEFPLHIASENNFPTAAGLASSAAGFAAMISAIALLYKLPTDPSELSKIARKGSGSACRSLFGGYVAWEMGKLDNGEDSKAVQIAEKKHWPDMKAAILVVSDMKKDVPSTSGMQLTVQTSDLFQHRIEEVVPQRYEEMRNAILNKDFPKFAELTMKDSNSFHAVCLDSYPPIFYLNDTSKNIIKLINLLNQSAGETIAAYTFDAGPNAVIYYEQKNEKFVLGMLHHFFSHLEGWAKYEPQNGVINDSFPLSALDREVYSRGVSRIILTQVGEGPTQTNDVLIDLESGLPKSN